MNASLDRSKAYYDHFSQSYEDQRHHGYHVLLDELEVEMAVKCGPGFVLEAGCGTGLILQRLEPSFRQAIGIDLSAGMLRTAQSRGLKVLQCSVDALPFPDNYFDAVVSYKVLAHVPNIEDALHELARVTRPGGHLVLEFYNRHSLRALVKRIKKPTLIGKQYHDTDVYTRYDTMDDIRGYLPAGLQITQVRGVRVVTPFAKLHDVPGLGMLLNATERLAADHAVLSRFGGFLIVVARKP